MTTDTMLMLANGAMVSAMLASLAYANRSKLSGLVERLRRWHKPQPKEEPMPKLGAVAAMLSSATAGAEALTDCGIDCDDGELVATFINGMDHAYGEFVAGIAKAQERALANGASLAELAPKDEALRLSMMISPCMSNAWFLWRLAHAFKSMASADVLEAAREVVKYGDGPAFVERDRAIAKLAAALPKEA